MNESASIRRAVAFEVEIDAVEAPGRKQCRDFSGEPRPRCRGVCGDRVENRRALREDREQYPVAHSVSLADAKRESSTCESRVALPALINRAFGAETHRPVGSEERRVGKEC